MSREIKIGDTVKYSAKFLKSAGICTGDICFAEGKVTGFTVLSKDSILAEVEWLKCLSGTGKVNVKNLIKKGRLEAD